MNEMCINEYLNIVCLFVVVLVFIYSLSRCIWDLDGRAGCWIILLLVIVLNAKEGKVLFNDALNTFIFGYMASDKW